MIANFRDVGGVRSIDGREIRTGVLYRSASLADLTDDGLAHLATLGIRTVIDLRRAVEVAEYGRVADADGRRYLNLSAMAEMWAHRDTDETAEPARYLADRYLELAVDGAAAYAQILRLLADDSAVPVIVHCFAGKDRTGVLVALALALVGVADEDIAHDYALSDEWSRSTAPDLPLRWSSAPADAIVLFLADLRVRYGSLNAYAASIGLTEADVAALRNALTN